MATGNNGPTKAQYFDYLGKEIEYEFQRMRWTAKSGHNQVRWEAIGGDRLELQVGRKMAKMDAPERAAYAGSIHNVLAWHGEIKEETDGQFSFAEAMDKASEDEAAGRTYPLGSAPSLGLAKIDGYRSGKKGSLNLADNPWPDDTMECGVWSAAYGEGMEDRPPPKVRSGSANPDDEGEDEPLPNDPPPVAVAPAVKPRGRPKGSKNKSAVDQMADKAAAMGSGKALTREVAAELDTKPGWDGQRDVTMPEPPARLN